MKIILVPIKNIAIDDFGDEKKISKIPTLNSGYSEQEIRKKIEDFDREIISKLNKGLSDRNRAMAKMHLQMRNKYARMIGEPEVEISIYE